ncbi:MAG: hypothetical protein JWM68_3669 [Verrucomicrobiales bacterium]|nr:hypothetical protein [Verrucomicrobiales bacterium]
MEAAGPARLADPRGVVAPTDNHRCGEAGGRIARQS